MYYINCFPTIMEAYKSNFPEDNNELVYYNFLLQNMPAIDFEGLNFYFCKITRIEQIINNGNTSKDCKYLITYTYEDRREICEEISSLKDLYERFCSNQNKCIPYSIKAEYMRDEGFRIFIKSNYSDLAKQLDDESNIEKRSECYKFFLQYFTRDHNVESRIAVIITDNQASFMISNHLEKNIHHPLMIKYLLKQSNADSDNFVFLCGDPRWERHPHEYYLTRLEVYSEGEISYKQKKLLLDIITAYKDAYESMTMGDKRVLRNYYSKCIENIEKMVNKTVCIDRVKKPDEIILEATCVESIAGISEQRGDKLNNKDERF